MAKDEKIPKTNPTEIEALIERVRQSNIETRDMELIERLLRTVMTLLNLLQRTAQKHFNSEAERPGLRGTNGKAQGARRGRRRKGGRERIITEFSGGASSDRNRAELE
jgi:hypothetical protein